jgi:hypothetical protein
MALEATKGASGFQRGRHHPAQRHPSVAAVLHSAAHAADAAVQVLDGVGRIERLGQRPGQPKLGDRERLSLALASISKLPTWTVLSTGWISETPSLPFDFLRLFVMAAPVCTTLSLRQGEPPLQISTTYGTSLGGSTGRDRGVRLEASGIRGAPQGGGRRG